MAKKEIRVVKASDMKDEAADLGKIVDRGAEVDAELKSLGSEDKGLKAKIAELVAPKLVSHETSLRVVGDAAEAVLTAADSFALVPESDRYGEVVKALDEGKLGGLVSRAKTLVVDPMDVERAREILEKAGVGAKVDVSTKVSADAVRELEQRQVTEPEAALLASLKRDTTYRVKFEKLKKG